MNHTRKICGFSLIEITISLIIISILTALVYPSYERLVKRARQIEAKTMLQSIYTAQKLYQVLNNVYSEDILSLDIEIPQNGIYQYTVEVTDTGGYIATATANLDSDEVIDTWTIDENRNLQNTIDDVIE